MIVMTVLLNHFGTRAINLLKQHSARITTTSGCQELMAAFKTPVSLHKYMCESDGKIKFLLAMLHSEAAERRTCAVLTCHARAAGTE
jgi:hypothetical protein